MNPPLQTLESLQALIAITETAIARRRTHVEGLETALAEHREQLEQDRYLVAKARARLREDYPDETEISGPSAPRRFWSRWFRSRSAR